MGARPKLEVKRTPGDMAVEWTGLLLLILLWVLAAYYFVLLPESIPVHFDAAGQPDSFGQKTSIFLLPGIATVLYTGLTILNRHPHFFNYPVKITPENAMRQYTAATRVIRYTKTVIVIVFTIIVVFTYLTAMEIREGIGRWFLPAILMVLLLPVAYFITKSVKEVK